MITYPDLVCVSREHKMNSIIDYSNPIYYEYCDVLIELKDKIRKNGKITILW